MVPCKISWTLMGNFQIIMRMSTSFYFRLCDNLISSSINVFIIPLYLELCWNSIFNNLQFLFFHNFSPVCTEDQYSRFPWMWCATTWEFQNWVMQTNASYAFTLYLEQFIVKQRRRSSEKL
jgi:hypothetical protein